MTSTAIRGGQMGSVQAQTLDQYQKKLQGWSRRMPRRVKRSLIQGTKILESDIKRRWGSQLRRRSGELMDSIRSEVTLRPLRARVYVEQKQQYKAQTHEHSRTITPRKKPYLTFKIDGQWVKVRSVTVPARSAFGPALESKQDDILALILRGVMESYDGKQATANH